MRWRFSAVLTCSGTRDWPKVTSAQGIHEHLLPRCSRTQNTWTAAQCTCMNCSGPSTELMENVLPFSWAWIPTGQPHLVPGLLMLPWGKIGWLKLWVASPTAQGFNTANWLTTVSVHYVHAALSTRRGSFIDNQVIGPQERKWSIHGGEWLSTERHVPSSAKSQVKAHCCYHA